MTTNAVDFYGYQIWVREQLERDEFLKSIGRSSERYNGLNLDYIEVYEYESERLWQAEKRRRADEKLECNVCHIKVDDPRHWRGTEPVHAGCLPKLRETE